jgi:uncharacterized membrane protein (UPF0182 family)
MTIGITGPERKAPGRNAVVGFFIAAIVFGIFLILLGLAGNFLVDWMWFSAIGYLQIFWTTIGTKAGVFFGVFITTAVIVWANARLALHFVQRRRIPAGFDWKLAATATPSDPLEFMRNRLPSDGC